MIQVTCGCGTPIEVPESAANTAAQCEGCGAIIHPVAAEQLPEHAGAGDFDAYLLVEAGPAHVGERYLLGGVAEIELGKLPSKHIMLPGTRVSRNHAKLVRLDFGPSRWQIVDTNSTNGVLVNGEAIAEQELQPGDVLELGEYSLRYGLEEPPPPPPPPPMPAQVAIGAGATATLPRAATRMPTSAGTLGYAKPKTYGDPDSLGHSDPEWVMKLRNAVGLMLWAIILNFIGGCITRSNETVGLFHGLFVSLMNWYAAWLITTPEPGTENRGGDSVVRLLLRIFATVSIVAQLLVAVGVAMDQMVLVFIGLPLMISAVAAHFLFLWYLRKLALRIPDEGLAMNIMIVMVGLPVLVLVAGGLAALMAVQNSTGGLLAVVVIGALALLGLAIWYIICLVWFRRSLT